MLGVFGGLCHNCLNQVCMVGQWVRTSHSYWFRQLWHKLHKSELCDLELAVWISIDRNLVKIKVAGNGITSVSFKKSPDPNLWATKYWHRSFTSGEEWIVLLHIYKLYSSINNGILYYYLINALTYRSKQLILCIRFCIIYHWGFTVLLWLMYLYYGYKNGSVPY